MLLARSLILVHVMSFPSSSSKWAMRVSEAEFCKAFLAVVDLFGIGVAFRAPTAADFWLGCPGSFALSLFVCESLLVECGGSPLAGKMGVIKESFYQDSSE